MAYILLFIIFVRYIPPNFNFGVDFLDSDSEDEIDWEDSINVYENSNDIVSELNIV